jgi:acetyl-CoA synthetase
MLAQFESFLGSLKKNLITGTLFSNFGEEALLYRLGDSKTKGIITKKSLFKKIDHIRIELPDLKYVILVDGEADPAAGFFPTLLMMPTIPRR